MKKAKHQHIYKELHRAITSGEYKEGDRLPGKAGPVEMFATSQPTAARDILLDCKLIVRESCGALLSHNGKAVGDGMEQ